MGRTNRLDGDAPIPKRDAAPTSRTKGVYRDATGIWTATHGTGKHRRKLRCPRAENTEAKARELRRKLEDEAKLQIDSKGGSAKMIDFAQGWINRKAHSGKKPKTIRYYQQMLELYLLPELGDVRLDRLTARHVDELLDAYRDAVGPRTLRHIFDTGKRIVGDAARRRLIAFNPFDAVEAPTFDAPEQTALTPSQIAALWDAVSEHRLSLLYLLTLLYGLREGEALGLRIDNYNPEHQTLSITQQVTAVGGKTIIDTPKTKSSIRTLPVPPWIAELLAERAQTVSEEAAHAKRWTEHGLLFPSEVGTPMSPRNLVRQYKEFLVKAELPRLITFHQLRHTANSRLAAQGMPVTIREWVMGHTVPGVQGRYTHPDVAAMRPGIAIAAEQLRAVLETEPVLVELKPRARRVG